jgi:hypothetical protein
MGIGAPGFGVAGAAGFGLAGATGFGLGAAGTVAGGMLTRVAPWKKSRGEYRGGWLVKLGAAV